jgi:DNA-binding PadR family transcriptional regulator
MLKKRRKCAIIKHMKLELLTDRYEEKISGVLGCLDRVIIQGDLSRINYPQGMEWHLYKNKIKIFDYTKFAQSFRDNLREQVAKIAKSHGLEFINGRRRGIKKENIAAAELEKKRQKDGEVKGLFCIIQAMESCPSFKPLYNNKNKTPALFYRERQCSHYYFYFMDEYLGLCFVRVPTWLPCRIKVYFNGHNWLAKRLEAEGIEYEMIDNAFSYIGDWKRAQEISDSLDVSKLHQLLDQFAQTFCPQYLTLGESYHWSILQAEYATDIIFRKQKDLQRIYPNLVETAIHIVKPENIATFLGRKLHGLYQGEVGNNYHVRLEGSRIKHMMGPVSLKMYDKLQLILRIETTANDIRFFKHYRMVDKKDGTTCKKFTSMKKYIYSMRALLEIMKASNRRYLEFISIIEDKSLGCKRLEKVTKRVEEKKRGYRGINFFAEDDLKVIKTVSRGEFIIYGFRNKDIKSFLPGKSSGQISRLLKRLRLHGLIRKAGKSYKYYLTTMGKQVLITALKIRELIIIPALNY